MKDFVSYHFYVGILIISICGLFFGSIYTKTKPQKILSKQQEKEERYYNPEEYALTFPSKYKKQQPAQQKTRPFIEERGEEGYYNPEEYEIMTRYYPSMKKDKKEKIMFCRGKPYVKEPTSKEQESVTKDKKPDWVVIFSGYIKPEFFVDTRQVYGCRDDQTLFYPDRHCYACGWRDVYAHPQFNILAIESRLRCEILGPPVKKAKSKGVFEVDFLGVTESVINSLRIRHAYAELNWENKAMLFGHYWHPMTSPECYPDTLSFNCGGPIDPFKRCPQARITKVVAPFEFIAAASSAIYFVNNGPIGYSSTYLRNAVVPNLSFLLQARPSTHLIGFGLDFKRLVPRLVSDNNLKVSESICSAMALAYVAFNWKRFALRTKLILAQNASDFCMMGGYAVHSIQPDTDVRSYTNLNSISAWVDFNLVNKKIEPGCLIGYTKNLGATKTIIPALLDGDSCTVLSYTFIPYDTDYIFRVSPRIRWFIKPVVFGAEIEYTQAAFGQINTRGRIDCAKSVGNTRFLAALFYFF